MEEIDLVDIIVKLWKKKIMILIITIIFLLIGIIYSCIIVTPKYKSESSVILIGINSVINESQENLDITATGFSENSKEVYTYGELIKSKSNCKKVIDNLGLDTSVGELQSSISVNIASNSEYIKIGVSNKDPEMAKNISNELAKVFKEQVKEIYEIDNIEIIDEAEVASKPYNTKYVRNITLFIIFGFTIACFIAYIVDEFSKIIKQIKEKITKEKEGEKRS